MPVNQPVLTFGARKFVVNARPDTLDFRDRMYSPTLVNVQAGLPIDVFCQAGVAIRDQGHEGACTGYALAAVADFLLRTRQPPQQTEPVSAHMLYAMARRYDEWPGEGYDGSSARGAMKGWFQHGVCRDALWPTSAEPPDSQQQRGADAVTRPLGAYYRVDHGDLVAMHAAISEVGVLYATAQVHTGWGEAGADGTIPLQERIVGGHAFAIVGYDGDGFWLQNSWSAQWGRGGFARIGYADWLRNGTDVWVARLGVPLILDRAAMRTTSLFSPNRTGAMDEVDTHALRPHIISLGNDGRFDQHGRFGNTLQDVVHLLHEDFDRITAGWPTRRLMLYAHGGLHSQDDAVEHIRHFREVFLAQQIYPVSIIWHTGLLSTLANMVEDSFAPRRPQGFLDLLLGEAADRLDDTIETLARKAGAKSVWDEMKDNARLASTSDGGGLYQILDQLPANAEVHLVGHSAGAVMHAWLAEALAGKRRRIDSCTLWAPACNTDLFYSHFLPLLKNRMIGLLSLFTLTDKAEQDDSCLVAYHKSLLYFVSNALERTPHIPFRQDGEPLLGLQRDLTRIQAELPGAFEWVLAPNGADHRDGSQAKRHTEFDDDSATIEATMERILGADRVQATLAELTRPLPGRCIAERRIALRGKMGW